MLFKGTVHCTRNFKYTFLSLGWHVRLTKVPLNLCMILDEWDMISFKGYTAVNRNRNFFIRNYAYNSFNFIYYLLHKQLNLIKRSKCVEFKNGTFFVLFPANSFVKFNLLSKLFHFPNCLKLFFSFLENVFYDEGI